MPTIDPSATLGTLVAERASRGDVLERFHLDYCCGGALPLDKACADLQIDLPTVLRALEAEDRKPLPPDARDWRAAPLDQLVDHIVGTHHVFLREILPRASARVEKIAKVHGTNHAELWVVRELFQKLHDEMLAHLKKEEEVIFPAVRAIAARKPLPEASLKEMVDEHEVVGSLLHRIRDLTNGYAPPADACATYRGALADLAAIEQDTHRHVHKENNILLPRAREMAGR
ncbi:MAG: iron-sulfur cluster repair di-iron protein [Candidatus Brocadiae bacterium]|nr:iron-sulfur cluster repair di-iron protein [Candidatus Brocadiia bacterium]